VNDEFTETGLHRAIKRRWPEASWLVPFLRYLTPALVGAAFATIVGWTVYVFNSPQKDIADIQKNIAKLVEQSQNTRNDVTSIKATVDDMKEDERDRWARVDKVVAEPQPHARRKR
jgi:low affinity Fe/Cu permease